MYKKIFTIFILIICIHSSQSCMKKSVQNSNTMQKSESDICRIEPAISVTTNCAPGGDPEITLYKNGTIIEKTMKEYGMASKGYDIVKGKYQIIMSSLKKRKFDTTSEPVVTKELWSAKIIIKYENRPSFTAYVIDTGDDKYIFEFSHLCSREYDLDSFSMSE